MANGIYNQAASQVDANLAPVLQALAGQQQQAALVRGQGLADAKNAYQSTHGDLNYIHAQAGSYLQGMNSNINSGYSAAAANTAAANEALQKQLGLNTKNNAAAATSEQQRMGLSGLGLGNFGADANFIQSIAAQTARNDQSNLETARAGASEVGNLLLGMNVGSRAQGLGTAKNNWATNAKGINDNYTNEANKIRQEMSNTRAQRNAMINELVNQLTAQAQAKADSDRAYALQREQFAASQGQNALDNKYRYDAMNNDNIWRRTELEMADAQGIRESELAYEELRRLYGPGMGLTRSRGGAIPKGNSSRGSGTNVADLIRRIQNMGSGTTTGQRQIAGVS